ncbi:hypothetical protein LY78DRAFT_679112 [Colletotrichum sublineola]|nr:hypothetical protein LY78DRAFT_679112 [Colletotrichum sublineola]
MSKLQLHSETKSILLLAEELVYITPNSTSRHFKFSTTNDNEEKEPPASIALVLRFCRDRLVKDRLRSSLGIDYTRSWTTQQGYLIRGTVDDGYTGVVVSRPWTNRRYGRTFQGCVGNLRQTGTFMADSHEEGSYEGVSWVGGAITACIKRQSSIPLSRCQGSGNFR